jgi:protein archease
VTVQAGPYGSFRERDVSADIGMELWAATREDLFAAAAWVLFHFMTDIRKVQPAIKVSLKLDRIENGDLMVNWLNELIYLHETRNMLFMEFEVSFTDQHLLAVIAGEKMDVLKHTQYALIKAATYHDLLVRDMFDDGWYARTVLDI